MTTASDKVPHDDFSEGFKIGFQTVQGVNNTIPAVPGEPGIPGGMTPFLMGVRAGIKAGKGTLAKQTNAGPPLT
ncbi:hypothetical protein [Methylobacterium sp. NEAU K]|uniref:hypothetical protein n=1 Tax=Methylobacterium sp. NEAU K TaxID=3064946 RepID=UPI00273382A9|nr:hypothetical protein [Methylobacterium sp. NEAU K]MDP4006904.1 hypothetical protein [Methylobacterium sp. NEAU K]